MGENAPRPDPGVQGLGRQLFVQRGEQALPEAILHTATPLARSCAHRSYTHTYPQVWITGGRSGDVPASYHLLLRTPLRLHRMRPGCVEPARERGTDGAADGLD